MRTLSDRVVIFASRAWYRLTGNYLLRPVVVNMFGGEALQVILPNRDGMFRGVWRFELGGDGRPVAELICKLTPSEARAVSRRDQSEVGFLEPVREGMADRDAMLTAMFTGPDGRKAPYLRMFCIPDTAKADEVALVAQLDKTVTQLTALHNGAGVSRVKRSVTKSKSWVKDSTPSEVRAPLSEVRSLVSA